jgi:hypothetical protein
MATTRPIATENTINFHNQLARLSWNNVLACDDTEMCFNLFRQDFTRSLSLTFLNESVSLIVISTKLTVM